MSKKPSKKHLLKSSLSVLLAEDQREKLAARPPEIDFRTALALHTQKIMDIVDDKYLAQNEEIAALRYAIERHETTRHGLNKQLPQLQGLLQRLRQRIRSLRLWTARVLADELDIDNEYAE